MIRVHIVAHNSPTYGWFMLYFQGAAEKQPLLAEGVIYDEKN